MILLTLLLAGCASLEKATGTTTYIIPEDQWNSIKEQIKAKDCPPGQKAIAVAVEAPSGGGTLTVRCQ